MADDIPERLIAMSRISRTFEYFTTKSFNHSIKLCTHFPTKSAFLKCSLQGSAAGGGMLTKNATSSLDTLEADIDWNTIISTLSKKDSEFLTSTRPGYYLLRNHENFQQQLIDLFDYSPDFAKLAKLEYVNSKDVLANYCSIVDSRATDLIGTYFSQFFRGVHSQNFGSRDGADVANTITVRINVPAISKNNCFIVMADDVPAIKLTFWPVEALGWISECTWPSRDVREELKEKHGCYLVPKQSQPGANDWRLTFSDIETDILNMLFKNENCYLAYFLLKSLFYAFVHVIKCQCSVQKIHPFGSYIVKTILLNMSKHNSPESTLWNDSKAALKEMLTKLFSGLKLGNIPHFIIPDLNILQSNLRDHDEDCRLLVRATKAVFFIRRDIDKHLGTLFAGIFAKGDLTVNNIPFFNYLMEQRSTLLNDANSKCIDSFRTMLHKKEKIKVTCPKLEVETTENATSYQKLLISLSNAITLSLNTENETLTELWRSLNVDQAW